MKGAAVVLAAVAALAGCNKPPATGEVTDYQHRGAWMQWIPGVPPMCTGSPPVCNPGTPGHFIWWPESWSVTVTNGDQSGDYSVEEAVFDRCAKLGSRWPECRDGVTE